MTYDDEDGRESREGVGGAPRKFSLLSHSSSMQTLCSIPTFPSPIISFIVCDFILPLLSLSVIPQSKNSQNSNVKREGQETGDRRHQRQKQTATAHITNQVISDVSRDIECISACTVFYCSLSSFIGKFVEVFGFKFLGIIF